MAQPSLVIETINGKLDVIYSNTDISFLIINRDPATAESTITYEHFKPTLVKADLSKLYPDESGIAAALTTNSDPPSFY